MPNRLLSEIIPRSGGTIINVAHNAAKLALTGLSTNQIIRVTSEQNRLEMYLGSIVGPPTVIVTNAGTSEDNLTYTQINGETYNDLPVYRNGNFFIQVGTKDAGAPNHFVLQNGNTNQWDYRTHEGPTTDNPWEGTWSSINGGVLPVPTVTQGLVSIGPEDESRWVILNKEYVSVTNEEKLSLDPINTRVGTKARISDAFIIRSANNIGATTAINGAYFKTIRHFPNLNLSDGIFNDKPYYVHESGLWVVYWNSAAWLVNDIDAAIGPFSCDEAYTMHPWGTTWFAPYNIVGDSIINPIYPALQEFTGTSNKQGGVLVTGEPYPGIYYKTSYINGKPRFMMSNNKTILFIQWDGERWALYNANTDIDIIFSSSDVATPDLATDWKKLFSITVINAPGTESTLNGEWTRRGIYNGKPYYRKVEDESIGDPFSNANERFIFWLSGSWRMKRTGEFTAYVSYEDTTSPDLVTTWFIEETSETSTPTVSLTPASVTITSVSEGELNAGATITDAGSQIVNKIYISNGQNEGRPHRTSLDGLSSITWVNYWKVLSEGDANYEDININLDNFANPWEVNQWTNADAGVNPPPTVVRNDVASEKNWKIL